MFNFRIGASLLACLFLSASSVAWAQGDIVMPKVLTHVDPTLPPGVTARETDVVLAVSLDATGVVLDIAVLTSGGPVFDRLAIEAVKQWTFSPALRDGKPFAAKIKVPVHFHGPHPPESDADSAGQGTAPNTGVSQTGPASTTAPQGTPNTNLPNTGTPGPQNPPKPGDPTGTNQPAAQSPLDVNVLGGRRQPPSRGAGDFHVDIGALALVPRQNAAKMLTLAPSIFLSNEGGEGHAERIYLRGFDAREGQDLELSAGGVPINESANLHGAGFADMHFVIPELVRSIRVVEGPFDPRQGNYAVAGSADYELGLAQRGVTVKYTYGTFNTHRAVALWGPGESVHTFGGAEIQTSDGFGQNRASKRATAMGQFEGQIGETGTYRIAATAYGVDYQSAGLLRVDDVTSGRKDFFDTYDPSQGGSGSRFSFSADIEGKSGGASLYQQVFLIQRGMRLRENFTGFLEDTQEAIQKPHVQRGDLFDLSVDETTFGARGKASYKTQLFGHRQEMEVGYFARGDRGQNTRSRIAKAAGTPYKTDASYDVTLGDIGLYGDLNLRITKWLSLRGGARADVLFYDVLDECAVQTVSRPEEDSSTVDESCLDQTRFGEHREAYQRTSSAGVRAMPRASVLVGPFQGFSLSLSAGTGIRSMDPRFITQNAGVQFASIEAYEGGVSYSRDFDTLHIGARSILFGTRVDRDLIFNQTEGRNVVSGGTTRIGWIGQARATGDFFDTNLSVTFTKSRFDETGLLVPYVPDVVVRWDGAVFRELPWLIFDHRARAAAAAGISYIGQRALPFGQRSDTIFTADASVTVGYRNFDLTVAATNLFDTQYRLTELNYASDFTSDGPPTLVPARHFAAGAPREVLFTLAANFGGGS
ncbi:MAG: TonB family protein [Polyangiaceae bacterium]|nr:TonB family protein [Polyangiaceae bacterium]